MVVHILLTILKVLGIIILSVLGLVVFLILMVLLMPVRYKITGYSEDAMELDIKISYLLCFFQGLIFIDKDGVRPEISLLWGLVKIPIKKKKPDYTKDFMDSDEEEKEDEDDEESTFEEDDEEDSFNDDEEYSEKSSDEDKKLLSSKTVKKGKKKKSKKKLSFSEVKDKWLTSSNKEAVKFLLAQVGYILKKYLPRKASGNLYFGTNDPATTGEIVGTISVIPFMYQRGLHIHPDFESEKFYIRGKLEAKGFVQPGVLVVVLVRLLINKNTRNLIKLFLEK